MNDFATLGLRADTTDLRNAQTELRNLTREGGQTEQRMGRATAAISGHWRRLAAAAGAAAGGIAAAFGFAASIREAEAYELRLNRIQAIIRATGGVAGRTSEQLEAQAQSLARASLESVDGVMQAQQTLLTFRSVQGQVFDEAIEAAMDLSAAMGQDLRSSIMQVGRALEDPARGVTALTRSGTVFTESQREMIRTMQEAGDIAGAQRLILTELQAQYGGVAREVPRLSGAVDSLGQSLANARRAMNDTLGLSDAWAGVVESADRLVQSATENMDRFADALRIAGSAIVGLTATQIPALIAGLGTLGGVMGLVTTAARVMAAAIAVAGGPIGITLGLLAAAASYLLIFRDNADELPPTLENVREAQDQLNTAMGNFAAGAPRAGAEAFAYAKNLEETARAALIAAEAILAFNEARLQGVSPEALEAMQAQPGWESNPMRGVLEQAAQAREQIEASRIALDNARETLRGLSLQAHTAGDALRGAFDLEPIIVDTTSVTEALDDALSRVSGSARQLSDSDVPDLTSSLDALASQMKQVESSFESAFVNFVTGTQSAREAIGNLLRDLARLAAQSAFRGLFGGMFGGGGGLLAGIFGGAPSFDGGGFTGMGPRTGGLDGKGGFPAILHPNERVIDYTKGGVAQQVVVRLELSGDIDARIQQGAQGVAVEVVREYDRSALPGRVQQIRTDPRRRG